MSGKFLPSYVRNMLPVECAWVGAFLEGEGSIGIWQDSRNHNKGLPRPGVYAYNTEIEPIATILRLVGGGGVSLLRPRDDRRKAQWVWQTRNIASVRDLLIQVRPFLASKQEKATEVIQCCEMLLQH